MPHADAAPLVDLDLPVVRELVADRYGQTATTVQRLARDRMMFRVATPAGEWVIRVGNGMDRYAAALSVLERVDYPAARVVADVAGELVTQVELGGERRDALAMTWVDGMTTPFEPPALAALGGALGRLHSLAAAAITAATDPHQGLPRIDRAGMLPANELRYALSNLLPVAAAVHDADRAEWARLVTACERGREFGEGLTPVFLHGDAHPWNSVQTASGSVALIDWDSAGPGPAVIDLAFLAVSCDTGAINRPPVPADPARLLAMVEAYGREMTLTASDLDALEDAVAFRLLVGLGVGFGTVVGLGRRPLQDPEIQWSMTRLAAAPDIAERVRTTLATG